MCNATRAMLLAVNGVVQLGSRGFFFSRNSSKHVDPHQLDLYIYIIYIIIYIYITATLAILFQGADIYMFFSLAVPKLSMLKLERIDGKILQGGPPKQK